MTPSTAEALEVLRIGQGQEDWLTFAAASDKLIRKTVTLGPERAHPVPGRPGRASRIHRDAPQRAASFEGNPGERA